MRTLASTAPVSALFTSIAYRARKPLAATPRPQTPWTQNGHLLQEFSLSLREQIWENEGLSQPGDFRRM